MDLTLNIRIQGKTYTMEKGDYFMDNHACIQLCKRNGECWYHKNYQDVSSIVVPKSVWKAVLRLTSEQDMLWRVYHNPDHHVEIYRPLFKEAKNDTIR
jgi:glyoxylate utilization-related uncharacterized protein